MSNQIGQDKWDLAPAPAPPPVFTIDLSLNPEDRYKSLAATYKTQLLGLTELFDTLLADVGFSAYLHGSVHSCARALLRKLHSPIETAELRGIHEVTGVPMYLLVCFNVLLDLLMGCTSGAVRTRERGQPRREAKMLHFRTLDWTMDPLRSVVVQLDFVRSRSANPQHVVARSITYVGFVGVLTGVRESLSLSLNFRAVHNATRATDHCRFYLHHLLVLLGRRQSISSILRDYTISEDHDETQPKTLGQIADELLPRHTTAAYLIFSDGGSAMVMEKDYGGGRLRQSDSFVAATNHDEDDTQLGILQVAAPAATAAGGRRPVKAPDLLAELLEESRDRLDCIASKWRSRVWKYRRHYRRSARQQELEAHASVTEAEVIQWVREYPTTNEQTHFAVVMDPSEGRVVWSEVYPQPVAYNLIDDEDESV